MEDAEGDRADGEEREGADEEGVEEREDKSVGGDGWFLLMIMVMEIKRGRSEEDLGVVRRWIGKELYKRRVDNKGEGEREEKEDREGEEVTRVGIEDALRFRENGADAQTRCWSCWRCHAGIELIVQVSKISELGDE